MCVLFGRAYFVLHYPVLRDEAIDSRLGLLKAQHYTYIGRAVARSVEFLGKRNHSPRRKLGFSMVSPDSSDEVRSHATASFLLV